MFRLLHYSDSHLSFDQYGNTTRLIDFAASLKEVLRVAIDMKVDAVVDTGDTFNSPHPDPFSIQALRHFIAELDKRMIRFIGIIGNHNRHEIQDRVPGADWFTAGRCCLN
jgi:DNA repair exonuclease SbcCD nuclease subunit